MFLLLGGLLSYIFGLMDILTNPDDFARDKDRFVRLVMQPEPVPVPKMKLGDEGNPDAGEGAKAREEEGKRGKKESKVEDAKGGPVKAVEDRRIAESAGVLGALTKANMDLNAVFGTGAMGGGLDDFLGGLIGTTNADQRGVGGLGLRGTG